MDLNDIIKHLQEIKQIFGDLPVFVNGVQGVGEMQEATRNCFSVVDYADWGETCQPAYKALQDSGYDGKVLDIGGWD